MKNVVIIGGGTGTFTLLNGLKHYKLNNDVIVSTADDGGSTGLLRKALGVVPPGDIRQCLLGLSNADKELKEIFSYRFESGQFKGHTVGNIILASLEKITGSVEKAITVASKMLDVRGAVVPVSLKPALLSALLSNGKKIVGEHIIDSPRSEVYIKKLLLSPVKVNPKAIQLIAKADLIIFGPGDLYTSTLPNLLVKGVKEAILKSKAKKILITNIMTKNGQTDGFAASDFLKVIQEYVGKKAVDLVLVNSQKPDKNTLELYKEEKAKIVEADIENIKKLGAQVVLKPLISKRTFKKSKSDKLSRSIVRHDSKKTAKIIWDLI